MIALCDSILPVYSSAAVMSVPLPAGSNTSRSRMSRSACRRPFRGGTTCSMRSVNSTAPTRSLLRMADMASTAASSLASSLLKRARVPNRSDPERSTASITVSSRSSM